MTPATTLVPSKNALRALRHLALCTPTIFVGAVGSVCGVAALNYETCRRVRMAEKIVETKRVLRSVSSGRGPAHLNALFDAAERGEDFTLESRSTRKKRRKHGTRSLSTAAVPQESDDNYESRSHDIGGDSDGQAAPPSQHQSDSRVPVSSVGDHAAANTSTQRVPNRPFRKIAITSSREHSLPGHRLNNHPISPNQSKAKDFPGCVETWSSKESQQNGAGQDVKSPSVGSSRTSSHMAGRPSPEARLSGTIIHRVPTTPRHQSRAAAPAGHSDDKSRTHRLGLKWTPQLYASQALGDGPPDGCEQLAAPTEHDLGTYLSEKEGEASDETGPAFSISRHLVMSDADGSIDKALGEYLDAVEETRSPVPPTFPSGAVLQGTEEPEPKKLARLMEFIHPHIRQLSKPAQFRRWNAVMRHYVQQDRAQDWLIAEAVFHAGRGLFQGGDVLSRPVFNLVRHLLSSEAHYEQARKILFPSKTFQPKTGTAGQNVVDNTTDLPARYLGLFCEQNPDYSACVEEMAKIITIARRSGHEPSEKLAMPLLRAAVRAGDMETAHSLLEELESIYEVRNIQRLWGEYAVWNAGSGNWAEAQWVLDRMQETGYSRHQPEQYASIFHRMVLHYLSKNNAHRTFGFAVNAIKYTGLIPTGRISRTIVCACIREHRYDLVNEWIRLVSEAFPRLTSGFMTPNGAWQLAHALQKAGASCRDIADTCRAIAHGCYDDPFPHYLRPLLADLVKLDLSQRLNAASALPSQAIFSRDGAPLMTMNQLLEEARRFSTSYGQASETKATKVELLKRDIAVQLSAVEELTRVFRGDVFMPDVADKVDDEMPELISTPRHPVSDTRAPAINSTFPDILKQDRLPGYQELSSALTDYYAMRSKQGLPTDHSLLKYLVDKVAIENPTDALDLMEQIYESEYVQGSIHGVPFDNDLFVKWLQVVTTLGSVKAASTVLWAVVDSSRHLRWTLDFSFCLNIVTYICVGSNKGKQKALLTPEMFYLGRRLWWTRLRSPGYVEDDFEFPKWRPWELALRDAATRSG